ncbi:hypothetical protein Enr13x_32800 [Stieleria neptunia]|uniref:Uncharacterized protein n=1 Tax=Stieleria neptunia TaxID=2527979 RepID=A0A518HRH0_9BACT|nr:hypothetical protein [Stieleria neptunia]QDV43424.1 hypothetical protein Enr13x_32800 [Stieleria neptunia]
MTQDESDDLDRAAAFGLLLAALGRHDVDDAQRHITTLERLGLGIEPANKVLERRRQREAKSPEAQQ